MLRAFLLALMLMYAVVPPGFCLCRLTRLAAPADAIPEDCQEHGPCDCPHVQQDGIAGDADDVTADREASGVALHDHDVACHLPTTAAVLTAEAVRPADTPLYLAVRALRI